MRRSFQIAKIFGIPVQIHWSFALLFLFVIYVGKSRDASWTNIAIFGLIIIALFFCVLLHEFGHALSARYYGIKTHDITILPIGGVARLDGLPEKPLHEFVVALAGPAVNLVIYALIALFLYISNSFSYSLSDLFSEESDKLITSPALNFLETMMKANCMLVVFNMIPAFPMDGGRVLRALLAMRFGRLKATKVAAFWGQVIAIGFLIYGLLPAIVHFLPENGAFQFLHDKITWGFQPVLTLISGFVFYTARTEYAQVCVEENLARFSASQIIRTEFTRLKTSDPLNTAIQELMRGKETNFLVFDDAQILRGVLLEEDILDALKNRHYDGIVSSYMTSKVEKTTPQATLKEVYEKIYRTNNAIIPVFNTDSELDETEIVGVIDAQKLEDFMPKN